MVLPVLSCCIVLVFSPEHPCSSRRTNKKTDQQAQNLWRDDFPLGAVSGFDCLESNCWVSNVVKKLLFFAQVNVKGKSCTQRVRFFNVYLRIARDYDFMSLKFSYDQIIANLLSNVNEIVRLLENVRKQGF